MQIYNLKEKTSRIVFGPNLVMLEPYETFSVNSLSGATPKKPGVVETLFLKLGPIFSTDAFDVETVDHTRLKLRIAYNWKFDLKKDDQVNGLKIFTIRDFIGDLCLTLGSKIRSFIATMTFDEFHKNSDRLIKSAVFGEDEKTHEVHKQLEYDSGLIVTDVDIQSVTPSDADTQKLLQQSVSLAIELATKTIKQGYNIQQLMKRQEFKGELDKLKMNNKIEFLKKEIDLNKLKIESEITEKTGLSRAQAAAEKDAIIIEYTSKKKLAEMDKQAFEVEELFELKKQEKINENEYLRTKEEQRVEIKNVTEKSKIESFKFKNIMEALGQQTLVEITRAGPELQAKLLQGLNLEGYIVTDGDNPINLFNVADTLVKKD
jgi:major vault protein